MRAELVGAAAAHPAVDPVGARLIAGGHHHAGSDDRQPAAKARIVPLLHRGEERVGVSVEDRRGR
jgi:hypothetical protein